MKIKPVIWLPALIMAVIILTVRFVVSSDRVPDEFLEARITGAALAQNVVSLSRQSLTRLDKIAKYDREGKFPQALSLISEELLENRKSQAEAARLASQLERMARLVSDIRPSSARELATEAISAEVALVSRLVTYNELLRNLFVVLNLKFDSRAAQELDGRVNELINQVNEEAKAINQFNKRFNNAMAKFDEIFKK